METKKYCQLTPHLTLVEAANLSKIHSLSRAFDNLMQRCLWFTLWVLLCLSEVSLLRAGKEGWDEENHKVGFQSLTLKGVIWSSTNSLIHKSSPCTKRYVLAHQIDKKYSPSPSPPHTQGLKWSSWRACAVQIHIGHFCHSVKCKAESLKIPLHNVCDIAYQSPSLFTSLIQSVSCNGKLK